MRPLLNSQQKAYNKFNELRVGALFMKYGTGKTQVACALANHNKEYVDVVYFFCPVSTKKNLEEEVSKCGLELPFRIIGWESLSQSNKIFLDLLSDVKKTRNFFIADESIFIKNGKSKRHKRIKELAKHSLFRLCLNGSPIVKNEWDLYYQMEFLSPKIINMNEAEFKNTFFTEFYYKEKGKAEKTWYKFSEVNAEYLTALIQPYIYECDFNFENGEFEKIECVDYSDETQEAYDGSIEQFYYQDSEELNVLQLFTKLQTILAVDVNKNKQVAEYVKDKQVIVYCSRIEELLMIQKNLADDCFVVRGGTPLNERNQIYQDFQKKSKPLLIMFGCGSHGLNLQFCNEIVYASIIFDYEKMDQSKGRIRRQGQQNDIFYTYYRTVFKFYDVIFENLTKKEKLSDIIKEKIIEGIEKFIDDIKERKDENLQ